MLGLDKIKEILYLETPIDFISHLNKDKLETVKILRGTKIPKAAFKNCTTLNTVTLSDKVKIESVEEDAFYNCINLKEFPWSAISLTCTTIAKQAFFSCSNLVQLTLPAALNPFEKENKIYPTAILSTNSYIRYFRAPVSGKYYFLADKLIAYYTIMYSENTKSQRWTAVELTEGQIVKIELIGFTTDTSIAQNDHSKYYIAIDTLSSNTVLDIKLAKSWLSIDMEAESDTWARAFSLNSVKPIYNELLSTFTFSIKTADTLVSGASVNNLSILAIRDNYDNNIGMNAFGGCNRLVEVFNDAGLALITGSDLFGAVAKNILNVVETRKNGYTESIVQFDSIYNIVYLKTAEGLTLFRCLSINNGELLLPPEVTKISKHAFTADTAISKLGNTTPVEIEAYAFYKCNSLIEANLAIKSIELNSFYDCQDLTTLTLNTGNELSIKGNPFKQCLKLHTINLLGTKYNLIAVENDNGAKNYCIVDTNNKLVTVFYTESKKIQIPQIVTSIGTRAFQNVAESLNQIIWPKSLTKFETEACVGIPLQTLDLSNITTDLTIGRSAFQSCGLTTLTFASSPNIEIADYAFSYNKLSTSLTIPTNIKKIDNYVFANNSTLQKIILKSDISNYTLGDWWNCKSILDQDKNTQNKYSISVEL
jgi:hypothetical protein